MLGEAVAYTVLFYEQSLLVTANMALRSCLKSQCMSTSLKASAANVLLASAGISINSTPLDVTFTNDHDHQHFLSGGKKKTFQSS